MKKIITVVVILLGIVQLAGAREVYNINRDWKFFTYNEKDSATVNLPHTWNDDALVGRKEYYRGIGNYLRYLDIRQEWRHKRIFVKFHGANSVATLMINGRFVDEHRGGNNAFVFEITDYVNFNGRNLLWVVVNNAARIDVLPTTGPENIYGGIFRDVELIVTGDAAIGLDQYGSGGVMFNASKITAEKASGTIDVNINSRLSRQVRLDVRVEDAAGNTAAEYTLRPRVEKGVTTVPVPFEINNPLLWQGVEYPHLYNVTVTLTDGSVVDAVSFRTGIREISVDAATGFFLNGKSYPLRGVVLYRDRASYGPVSTEAQLIQDIDMIREMGANAIRVAGGTHHPDFYSICDERGIIVMSDSPFVGASSLENKGFYNTPDFRENARLQLSEMIYQLYNHPSIAVWGIFSDPEIRGDNPVAFIKELNALAKKADPARLTAGASNKDGDVNTVTDLIVWNHTLGWLEGMPEDIVIWRDQLHSNPSWRRIRSAVSWKCGGSVYHQSQELTRSRMYSNWHPENWQTHLHEVYLQALGNDKAFWGLFAGNMFDSGSVKYTWGEGRGVTDYGVATFDRAICKDAFYLYKANWNSDDPFVYLTEKRLDVRTGNSHNIKVYSNMTDVELTVNGISLGTAKGKNGIFRWENVRLSNGMNRIVVSGGAGIEDSAMIRIDTQQIM